MIFNLVFDTGSIPEFWLQGITVSIYKNKGSVSALNQYRNYTIFMLSKPLPIHYEWKTFYVFWWNWIFIRITDWTSKGLFYCWQYDVFHFFRIIKGTKILAGTKRTQPRDKDQTWKTNNKEHKITKQHIHNNKSKWATRLH